MLRYARRSGTSNHNSLRACFTAGTYFDEFGRCGGFYS
jgi:hypothetical protein